jgi:hypothetical protein
MTVEIVRKGNTTFTATCFKCSTVFSYSLGDIQTNYVKGGEGVYCPVCAEFHHHRGWAGDERSGGRGGCSGGRRGLGWLSEDGAYRLGMIAQRACR